VEALRAIERAALRLPMPPQPDCGRCERPTRNRTGRQEDVAWSVDVGASRCLTASNSIETTKALRELFCSLAWLASRSCKGGGIRT